MFDVPNAKRVRRDELLSRASSSRSPSPAPENTVTDGYQRLGELLNLDSLLGPTTPEQQKEEPLANQQDEQPHEDEDEEQEFEFRLFSAPSGAAHPTADTTTPGTQDASAGGEGGTQKLRIRLRSPSPGAAGSGEGRIVNPFRGWEYYFTAPGLLSGTTGVGEDAEFQMKRSQFEEVAVSGEDMRAWAKVDWPGCHLPWKVIRLRRDQTKLPRGSAVTYVMGPPEKTPKSVKKPGKKRRLQLRKRVTAAEDAKKQDAEKRTRKNREKKIKRRQKAREEKAAAAAAAGQDVPASPVDEDMLSQDGSD
ncbi:DUF2011 domain-containing protein [Aspergillus candidus]|uniref:Uncharacterized protein n=1 Tax=Aspergillus candidus TaxID=41067 RepID=A0A2I2FG80_ASPCN|nr:hypothetical protein BDW47DRAFT_102827 [Aspergillus candidus]PLB39632.1 hypothetical protein BDW47DRAFT_102827 [Aspergillus candidus]